MKKILKFNLFWSIIYLLMQSRLPSVKCHPNGELLGGRRISAVRLPHPAAESKGPPPCFRNYGTKEVIFMQKAKNLKSSNNIKMICLAGVMAALYVCLDFLAVSVSAPFGNNLKISISGLPVIIVAVFCGPWWGAATGFIGAFKAYSDAVALFGTDLNAAEMNTIVGYIYDMLYGNSGGYPSYASAAAIILFTIVLTITCINLLVSKKHVHY